MTEQQKKALMQQVARWARAQGKPRPVTQEGWKVLVAEFVAQAQAYRLAQQAMQAAEAPEDGEGGSEGEVVAGGDVHLINDGVTVQIADRVPESPFISDWDQMLKDRAAAAIGPNGEMLDDFNQEFQYIGRQHAELQKVAPFTRTSPPSLLLGSLGGQAETVSGGEPVTVANWIGEDAETCPVTVVLGPIGQVSPSFTDTDPAVTPARPYATILFGTRGFSVSVDVDVGSGCAFTVNASSVMLKLGQPSAVAGLSNRTMVLTGMLSFKTGFRTTPVTRTLYWDSDVDGLNNARFAVPAFAKTVQVVTQNGASTSTFQMVVFDSRGTAIMTYVQPAGDYAMKAPVLLPADAAVIRVDANGGTNLGHVRLVFELAL